MNVARHAQRRGASVRRSSTSRPTTSSTGAKREPYVESDEPRPAVRLRAHEARRASARSGERLDRPLVVALRAGPGSNFVRTMLRLGAERDEVAVVDDQRGSPTYVGHLAEATRRSSSCRTASTTSPRHGDCTWAEFAEAIFEEAGPATAVSAGSRPPSSDARAPRPAYSVLRSEQPDAPRLPHWREGLRECLARLHWPVAVAAFSRRRRCGPQWTVHLNCRKRDKATGTKGCDVSSPGTRSAQGPKQAFEPSVHQGFRRCESSALRAAPAALSGSHCAKRLAGATRSSSSTSSPTRATEANLEGADVEFVTATSADPDAGRRRPAQGCEAIVNFAAETHVDRSILGAAEFIAHRRARHARACSTTRANTARRFVQVSTDEVYGDVVRRPRSSREDDPLRPSSPYCRLKAGGDLQVLAAVRTYGVNASITRGANTYGPNQYPEKLIPLFITNALDGESLPVYGDGASSAATGCTSRITAPGSSSSCAKASPAGSTTSAAARKSRTATSRARILELTGTDESLVRHVEDRPGHDRRYSLDTSRLRALGWEPRHTLADGLPETVAWYRDNRDWWEPIKSGEYLEYYRRQYAARLS